MSLVYFSIPLVGGYFVMQVAIGQAEKNNGKNGEKLREKLNGSPHDLEREYKVNPYIEQQKLAIQRTLDAIKNEK